MKTKKIKSNFRKMILMGVSLLMLAFMQSCNDSDGTGTAEVKFKLVDAPGDYDQVNVEVIDIQYNQGDEEGWKSLESFEGSLKLDLTTLVGGENEILANEVVPANTLHQVRLILGDDNTVLLKGETELKALATPSAQQSGLKINIDENLEAGFSYIFILDWDAQQSIVSQGNGSYSLKPVIRVSAEKNSAIIQGLVVEAGSDDENDIIIEGATVSLYNSSEELITQTESSATGSFKIEGVSGGSYLLKVSKEGYTDYMSETSFEVTVGNIEDLGMIELNQIDISI